MGSQAWDRLIEFLDGWCVAHEVAPHLVHIVLPRRGASGRLVQLGMSDEDWDDVWSVANGDLDLALQEVRRALLAMRPEEEYLVVEQYSLVARSSLPGGMGWFAYAPLSEGVDTEEDDVEPTVRRVFLDADEHAAPFWCQDACLGDEFPELNRLLGLSRALYDDVMAWHRDALAASADDRAIFDRLQGLHRRLREELPAAIEVPTPLDEPPRPIGLDDVLTEPDLVARLPQPLLTELQHWSAQRDTLDYDDPARAPTVFAWEDRGGLLLGVTQRLLGPTLAIRRW